MYERWCDTNAAREKPLVPPSMRPQATSASTRAVTPPGDERERSKTEPQLTQQAKGISNRGDHQLPHGGEARRGGRGEAMAPNHTFVTDTGLGEADGGNPLTAPSAMAIG